MKTTEKKFAHSQSGQQGFFGKIWLYEYWYQLVYQFFPGYNFDDMVFVAKTVTLKKRTGNTKLRSGYKMRHFLPTSIWVSWKSFLRGYMLNAVGLSNPGLPFILIQRYWQKRKNEHFHISLQSEATTPEEIEIETRDTAIILKYFLSPEEYSYTIESNESCPNTGHSTEIDMGKLEMIKRKVAIIKSILPDVKVRLKFNALVPGKVLVLLKDHCDGFIISNTIPFGTPCGIDWEELFERGKSPLPARLGKTGEEAKKFEGGLSGAPIFPVVLEAIQGFEALDDTLDIIVGGGIMKKSDIDKLLPYKIVTGTAHGCVSVLRFWRVKSLAKYANKVFAERKKKELLTN